MAEFIDDTVVGGGGATPQPKIVFYDTSKLAEQYNRKGAASFQRGLFVGAIINFEEARKLSPSNPHNYSFNLAQTYYALNLHHMARKELGTIPEDVREADEDMMKLWASVGGYL